MRRVAAALIATLMPTERVNHCAPGRNRLRAWPDGGVRCWVRVERTMVTSSTPHTNSFFSCRLIHPDQDIPDEQRIGTEK